jgi:hypothetical protein
MKHTKEQIFLSIAADGRKFSINQSYGSMHRHAKHKLCFINSIMGYMYSNMIITSDKEGTDLSLHNINQGNST